MDAEAAASRKLPMCCESTKKYGLSVAATVVMHRETIRKATSSAAVAFWFKEYLAMVCFLTIYHIL
jgi:hypothetical protein